MADLLVLTAGTEPDEAVEALTTAVARSLHLTVTRRPLPAGTEDVQAALLLAVEDPSVRMVIVPSEPGPPARVVTEVIGHCPKPVLVVPAGRGAPLVGQLSRVLVPLDGTVESAQTVAETVTLFAKSGADIVILHVFDQETVPRFWDQGVHERASWEAEFLARFCDQPDARLELRTGSPGESILDVAAVEHVDLIALGWGQNLAAGRARTVRRALAHAGTPVLLLPGAHGKKAPRARATTATGRT